MRVQIGKNDREDRRLRTLAAQSGAASVAEFLRGLVDAQEARQQDEIARQCDPLRISEALYRAACAGDATVLVEFGEDEEGERALFFGTSIDGELFQSLDGLIDHLVEIGPQEKKEIGE